MIILKSSFTPSIIRDNLLTRLICLTILSLVLATKTYSQEPLNKYRNRIAPTIGVSRQSETFLDVNLNLYSVDTNQIKLMLFKGFRLGVESNLKSENFIWGPKVGYEVAGTTVLRLSAVNYFDKGNVDVRLLPEVGLSICGTVSILYGYNIPLNDYQSSNVGYHKFSLCILLDPPYWKRLGML